ncbi:hypothetical protein CLU79DRAFT_709975 [Phycomyces nitens]|nr:hypothetical protein CLU79DRAFT_709975 [Phycomyces nitens]
MDRIRSSAKITIHLENSQLVMHGSPSESSGCVLRGVLEVNFQEPTKVKAIRLHFSGKSNLCVVMSSHYEASHVEQRELISHTWTFLRPQPKLHQMSVGNHFFEFELLLEGKLPETTSIGNHYDVSYQLKAVIERSKFLPNHTERRDVRIWRQISGLSFDSSPVSVAGQWANKLDYEISTPTKQYSHGDEIPVSLSVIPLSNDIKVRHLICIFKEYLVCRSTSPMSHRSSQTHTRIIHSSHDFGFGKENNGSQPDFFVSWVKELAIQVPRSPDAIQCDVRNKFVSVRHKLKFVISLQNADGHVSELRAILPIAIVCAVNDNGLPAYEEIGRTSPYNPAALTALLQGLERDQESSDEGAFEPADILETSLNGVHLPTYSSLFMTPFTAA